jgi:hypothetical protein
VHHRQDHYGGRFNGIQKAERKSFEESAANPVFDYRVGVRTAAQGIGYSLDLMEKPYA